MGTNQVLTTFMRKNRPKGRFIITRAGCYACSIMKRVVNKVNSRLPQDKRFRIIDNTSAELSNIKNDFVQDKVKDKNFTSYPIFYFNGSMILGAEEEKYLLVRISKFVEEEYVY